MNTNEIIKKYEKEICPNCTHYNDIEYNRKQE
jgi:hypothetical protein